MSNLIRTIKRTAAKDRMKNMNLKKILKQKQTDSKKKYSFFSENWKNYI